MQGSSELTGIRLPTPWPPPDYLVYDELVRDPPRPYVSVQQAAEPAVRIDVGRQLFVDNFLIESSQTTLIRKWHTASVESLRTLIPSKHWEEGSNGRRTARPFGGASLLNPVTQQVHLYYRCGWRGQKGRTCLAVSRDGRNFMKPALFSGGTNIVMEAAANEATEIVYDHLSKPARFVALRNEAMPMREPPFFLPWRRYTSVDGVRWSLDERSAGARGVGQMADRSTFFLNPLRQACVDIFAS